MAGFRGIIEASQSSAKWSSRAREVADPDGQTDRSQQVIGAAPVGRIGTAADIARMALFLASPASDFVTGQAYNVHGDLIMH